MTDTPKTKRKRRFLRFSLRTLLLVMLVLCVVLGWTVNRAQQRRAVQAVKEMGGSVIYDFEAVPDEAEPPDRRVPRWSRWACRETKSWQWSKSMP